LSCRPEKKQKLSIWLLDSNKSHISDFARKKWGTYTKQKQKQLYFQVVEKSRGGQTGLEAASGGSSHIQK